jgi:hypothetical protein
MLELLAEDDVLRKRLGAAAAAFAGREHDVGRAADLYLDAVEDVAGGPAVREALLGEVARAAHEVGIDAYDPELAEVAVRMREVGLGH